MKAVIIMDITTIKYPSHNDLVKWYYQLAQRIADSTGVTPEQVNELIDAYITEHPYPVVPDNVITEDNIAQNAVTSFNGEKGIINYTAPVTSVNGQTGAVTVDEPPENVITADNIEENAVVSFNGEKGSINYKPPVTSVNGMTGDLFTTVLRSSSDGSWAFCIPLQNGFALVFAFINFTFRGIDITYNATLSAELNIKPSHVFSWVALTNTLSSVLGSTSNPDTRTIKIFVDGPDAPSTPPETTWAGVILYGIL